eukprot:CAMPEP_0117559708 /NCGR_PEP_ID=MMETSP0784-20121206/53500_1 /TAXON_ID=39447 /ORGANISM="" /LENGTH=42 /DNA_ID= /DNA_START= /DNA_END= /DNA_ORIENTATION=
MSELPESIEEVREPRLWHLRAAVVVAARAIVDAAERGDASRA